MESIDQLERKIEQLESRLEELLSKVGELTEKSEQALDKALHAFKVDHYGYIWTWNVDEQKYNKTNMRILMPDSREIGGINQEK